MIMITKQVVLVVCRQADRQGCRQAERQTNSLASCGRRECLMVAMSLVVVNDNVRQAGRQAGGQAGRQAGR